MALPEYQRTVMRQVQQADMSEARVWETLANQLDNFGRTIGSVASNINANNKAAAAAQKKANDLVTKNYLDSMEADIIEAAHKASVNNPDSYEGYLNEYNAQSKIWLEAKGLDSMSGARQLLTTMINNKRQQYGEKPYEVEQAKIKAEAIKAAEKNLDVDIKDFIHQAGTFLEKGMNPPLDAQLEDDIFTKMDLNVMQQYDKLQAKINDIVTLNGQTPEEAVTFEVAMQEQYISGVIGKQLTQEVNNNAGWDAL